MAISQWKIYHKLYNLQKGYPMKICQFLKAYCYIKMLRVVSWNIKISWGVIFITKILGNRTKKYLPTKRLIQYLPDVLDRHLKLSRKYKSYSDWNQLWKAPQLLEAHIHLNFGFLELLSMFSLIISHVSSISKRWIICDIF